MKKSSITPLFHFFSLLFVTCLLISNVVASKMIQLGPWSITAGVLIFPIAYIMSDVIAEVYGFKAARQVMWLGFAMNALMVLYFQLAILLPAPAWFQGSESFKLTLGSTPRILGASLTAYVAGSFLNAAVISRMKVLSGGKHFGVRAIVSTLVGESVDSCIFITLAFIGTMPAAAMLPMIITQVVMKTAYEAVALPLTTVIVKKVKKAEGVDVYDEGIEYGLFN